MKRNFLILIPAFLVLLVFGNSALALPSPSVGDSVKFEYAGGNADGGGAFNMSSPTNSFISQLVFCLELNEYIQIPTPDGYWIWDISDAAIAGGGGAQNGKDPISYETAYVYTNFLAGNYNALDSDHNVIKNAVQAAIWELEDEKNIEIGRSYTGIAQGILDGAVAAVFNNEWTGLGSVRVANIGKNSVFDPYKQSMLIAVPEPTTILLSGIGLLGLAAFLRRRFSDKA